MTGAATGKSGRKEFEKLLEDAKCSVDFREAFAWAPSPTERVELERIKKEAKADDVINLQFTRYVVCRSGGSTGAQSIL